MYTIAEEVSKGETLYVTDYTKVVVGREPKLKTDIHNNLFRASKYVQMSEALKHAEKLQSKYPHHDFDVVEIEDFIFADKRNVNVVDTTKLYIKYKGIGVIQLQNIGIEVNKGTRIVTLETETHDIVISYECKVQWDSITRFLDKLNSQCTYLYGVLDLDKEIQYHVEEYALEQTVVPVIKQEVNAHDNKEDAKGIQKLER